MILADAASRWPLRWFFSADTLAAGHVVISIVVLGWLR